MAEARTVLRYAPDLADNVLAGCESLDKAYATALERREDASGGNHDRVVWSFFIHRYLDLQKIDLQLIGKSALITGESKRIGRGVAEVLAAEGCHLHLATRTQADLEKARTELMADHGVEVGNLIFDVTARCRPLFLASRVEVGFDSSGISTKDTGRSGLSGDPVSPGPGNTGDRRSPSKSARVADIIFGHDIGHDIEHVFGH